MVVNSEHYKDQWLKYNGRTVRIEGMACVIEVKCWKAFYPYEREVLTVSAVPLAKSSRQYKVTKEQLGDDWSFDVLEGIQMIGEVLAQLE